LGGKASPSSVCLCCDMVMAAVKKEQPDLRKKVLSTVVVRQRKSLRRKGGVFVYLERMRSISFIFLYI
nr:60S ribosomal protein L23 [Tanacetum cinerariifolium]